MRRREFLAALCAAGAALSLPSGGALAQEPARRPNIVLVYADDIGYGDFTCYGAKGVDTPHIDRLAATGLRFTSAYAPSATCTPSRYAMLTGEYAWRKKGTGVLPGNARMIIEPGRTTLPGILKKAGYTTAVVGKWHLGLGDGDIDWNGEISPCPLDIGFDYSFIMAATGDRVPCVYIENRRVVGLDPADPIEVSYGKGFEGQPTGQSHRDSLKMDWSHGHNATIVNGISRIGHMKGGEKARWVDEDMADEFTKRALAFIDREKDNPFFLYFATHDIHVPRVPHGRFVGESAMGPRGDAIAQLDWCVGQIMAALERNGLAENTMVIVTSDNGPVLDDGYKDDANEKLGDHKPAGPWRAGKYSLFEGGTRMPFITHWPGRIKPGVSDAIVGQVDLPSAFAAFTGQGLPEDAAPDAINVMPALLGDSPKGRGDIVLHAGGTALRAGDWKYIPAGSTRDQLGPWKQAKFDAPGALFNLKDDPGETTNLASVNPEKLKELQARLEEIQERGRSR